ncbi:MAG: DNA mismatch repair protein [Clostridiales bacterium]|nr:DNA mismatch repair protein [Clostridiales bacterium]
MGKLSILYPYQDSVTYSPIPDESWHDTGMDAVCGKLTALKNEQVLIRQVMINLTDDPRVASFRAEVFDDIISHPAITKRLMKLLDHIKMLNDYGAVRRYSDDAAGVWDLLHRLDEMGDYIRSVEEIHDCLKDDTLKSEGLIRLREDIGKIYDDGDFGELKKDVEALRADTRNLCSATVGINLNERFEAVSFGLISVNSKPFYGASVIRNFASALMRRDNLKDGTEWNDDYGFHPSTQPSSGGIAASADRMVRMRNPLIALTMAPAPNNDGTTEIPRQIDNSATLMLSATCRKLREVLSRHVNISIRDISDLIPEMLYYVRWAEWIEKNREKGYVFSKPVTDLSGNTGMRARGFYNLKLIQTEPAENIVRNDLDFDDSGMVYILTGANRGGKTTVTQAVGQLFIMAQGGIHVPAEQFTYTPADAIYTHFPADEDKTLDLGRLGEECRRFKEMYSACTASSLMLLNETFSTTSFEEGYYIACDAVRAIIAKKTRTIYNTHMHKLATDLCGADHPGIRSLIVKSEGNRRSFRIALEPPEGRSLADDIARKYGVTYDMLTGGRED